MQVNNRLFEIVYILLQKKKTTAKELADRFEVSTRTIYRDIETLSRANIPIYANKGKDGGIALLDEYVLNKTILSEEEQNQILFALQGMKKVKGQEQEDILEKLSILFNKKIDDLIKIDFSNWGYAKEERFDIIKSAILNKQLVQFTYYNSNGEKSKRIVEPLQIWFKDKSWYLVSYCKLKEDYRILIDGGYAETYNRYLKQRLQVLAAQGKRINLLVITHIDSDHIGGILAFLKENGSASNPLVIGIDEVWYNGFFHMNTEDVQEGPVPYTLKEILKERKSGR